MTKISQLSDLGANLAANDEFIIRDVSDASTPNKKVTSSGFVDYIIAQGTGSGFTQIAAGAGPLAQALATSSGATGTLAFSTAAATTLIERARIDSSGRLLVGTSTARSNFDNTTNTVRGQIEGGNGANSSLALIGNANATNLEQSRLIFAKSQGVGIGTNGLVGNSDVIGELSFQGNDGTEFVEAAKITCTVDGTPGADDMPGRLVFSTTADGASSPTERMRITNGGKLLLGTTTTGGTLTVDGVDTFSSGTTSTYAITCGNDSGSALGFGSDASFSYVQSFAGRPLIINTLGNEVRIAGTTDQGAYNLQCNGTGVWGAGAYVNGSDERLKNNIEDFGPALEVVKSLRPVTFQYKEEYSKDQSVQPGFIAQELQEAMADQPYLEGIVQAGPEYLNVAYQGLIAVLVKAVQELEAKVAALEAS
jgi:hypothetical protein